MSSQSLFAEFSGKQLPFRIRTYMMIHKAKFKLESLTFRGMKLLLARQSERDYWSLLLRICHLLGFLTDSV
jgi:hypothetical protein